MSREKKKLREEMNIQAWKKFMQDKFNPTRVHKAMLLYTWYLGDSDLLTQAYVNASRTNYATSVSDNRNSKTYFWSLASQEADIKRSHSGLCKAITKTLINILDYPASKVMIDSVEDGIIKTIENKVDTDRLDAILEENDFENLVKQQQEPLTWCMGDGVYLVNTLPEISDLPVIEYVDARNCAFEIKANRITKVYARSYYQDNNVGYMLLQERGTDMLEGKKTAYIKYNLFRLNNEESRDIAQEVALDTIEETKDLNPKMYIIGMDEILASPCVYDYEPIQQRGTSMYNEKMDLFDDLDQVISQDSNCIRLSTPVETIDESMIESDEDGNPIPPKRFDRRYMVVKGKGINSVGENGSGITSSVPQIDFSRYSNEALALTSEIITGLISPCTIGADVSKKDNAEAQREKEKQTMFTRQALIKMQSAIFTRLFRVVLKLDDVVHKRKAKEYDIAIDYEEYGNPTFDAKLQALSPAFSSGGISPERYVEELYGDSLTDDEKEKEIEYLYSQRQTGYAVDDPMAYSVDEV